MVFRLSLGGGRKAEVMRATTLRPDSAGALPTGPCSPIPQPYPWTESTRCVVGDFFATSPPVRGWASGFVSMYLSTQRAGYLSFAAERAHP